MIGGRARGGGYRRLAYRWLRDVGAYSRNVIGRGLREYQVEVAEAIVASVVRRRGRTFAVMMSRQAGKNETSAQVEAYLMSLFQRVGGWGVKASPTFKPQTINSLMRLDQCLDNRWTRGRVRRENAYIRRLGRARWAFFSAQPAAKVAAATASILLEGDEAQDIDGEKWNKEFRPMGASTNATTVLWGTAWTSTTLLARTIRALEGMERRDGVKRVFKVTWDRVAESVPAYGRYVEGEIARLGKDHPLVRTQYLLEEIDDQAGMFPSSLQVLMHGDHERVDAPVAGREYAFLVDVAGSELGLRDLTAVPSPLPCGAGEGLGVGADRDYAAVTILEVDRSQMQDVGIGAPIYRVATRYSWLNVPIPEQYGRLMALEEVWHPRWVMVDATGLGQGLFSLVSRRLGERAVPMVFTGKSKSDLGWKFLGICGTGRFRDHADDGSEEYREFWRQVDLAEYELLPGPNKTMRWGVNVDGEHDDLVISAAMCAALEDLAGAYVPSEIVRAGDVLDG